ncbi:hypothetical protein PTMSG1_05793 [Pyrenophora teres f. maculata]|nr:hypothetical protein PTMSG1_05793 [Pyrenophora teres f. maculata]
MKLTLALLLLSTTTSILANPARPDCGQTKTFTASNDCGLSYGGYALSPSSLTDMDRLRLWHTRHTHLHNACVLPHQHLLSHDTNHHSTCCIRHIPPPLPPRKPENQHHHNILSQTNDLYRRPQVLWGDRDEIWGVLRYVHAFALAYGACVYDYGICGWVCGNA